MSAICWAIWKLRNRACFDGKLINSPVDLICYSVGLNNDTDHQALRTGAKSLVVIAMAARESNPPAPSLALLGDGTSSSNP
jgi:hypothetical protein